MLSWSAPWPYHPEAELFINHALTHHFGAGKQWHFSRDDEQQRGHVWKGGSKVIDRPPAPALPSSAAVGATHRPADERASHAPDHNPAASRPG